MQAMNVKYEISPYMTRTKDVVSLSERKKERKVRGFPKSGEKEEQGGGGGKGEEKRDLSPEPILDPGKRIYESFQLAPPLWGGPCISYFHIWT